MKPHYTLQESKQFFRVLSSVHGLEALFLMDRFNGCYISDIALVLRITQAQVTNICRQLAQSGIINKESVTRSQGRMVKVTIDEKAREVLAPFLSNISNDPEIATMVKFYQLLKDTNHLVSGRYGL